MRQGNATRGGAEAVAAALDGLWQTAEPTFRERVAVIEGHVAGLLVRQDSSGVDAAAGAAHKLAGTLGMFGMDTGTELARELEDLLRGGEEPSITQLDRMAEITNQLRRAIDQRAQATPARRSPTPGTDLQRVLRIVGRRSGFLESLAWSCTGRGIHVLHSDDPNDAVVRRDRPVDAVVIDAASVDNVAAAMAGTMEQGPVPAVVLTDDEDLSARMIHVRAGARVVMSSRAGVDRVADAIERIVHTEASELAAVAIGIAPEVADAAVAGFAAEGCSIDVLASCALLADAIERVAPDVLVVGPETDIMDALAVVNADPAWSARHVVALVADADDAAAMTPVALARGADDVVSIDRGWAQIARRVRLRTDRVPQGDRGRFGPAGSRARLAAQLDGLVTDALNGGPPAALLYLQAQGIRDINARDGYAAGDRRLASIHRLLMSRFRSGDGAGAWVGGGFVAGLKVDREVATRRLQSTLGDLERADLPCTGAIAMAPDDGPTVDALVATAARRASAGRTPTRASSERATRRIVVVEDDPVVAGLVRELLEAADHRVDVITDGPSAVDALTDPDVAEAVALVLLDITLPGIDGFGVLRAMRRSNTLPIIPVVMLTARVRADEVATALELGAVDHVAKPFSPAVLLRRVDLALALTVPQRMP